MLINLLNVLQILPKRSGAPQIQGIYTSPRTTIILAPPAVAAASAVPLGTPLSSSLILPAPPTFTITLAAHQGPQPTPVILPLTKTTALSSNAHMQCAPIAPKIASVMVNYYTLLNSSVHLCCLGHLCHMPKIAIKLASK